MLEGGDAQGHSHPETGLLSVRQSIHAQPSSISSVAKASWTGRDLSQSIQCECAGDAAIAGLDKVVSESSETWCYS